MDGGIFAENQPARSSLADTERVRSSARSAWVLGITAITLSMVGPCMSYFPMMLAVPLALVSIYQARTALRSTDVDEAGRVYGQTAMLTSGIALGWSATVLLIIAAFLLMYFGLIATYIGLIFAILAAGPPPQ